MYGELGGFKAGAVRTSGCFLELREFFGEMRSPIAARNVSRMELVVCLSTSWREVLGPTHKEICHGFDGFKNRPSNQ
ncbi:hypothetical protein BG015_002746, partial [Linnemannia schmuckeri]